jgi:hypothetical protein
VSPPRAGRAVAALLLAGAALAVTPATQGAEVAPPRSRLEADVFTDAASGFRIGKPSDWYFLPVRAVVEQAHRAGGLPAPGPGADLVASAGFSVIVARSPTLGSDLAPHVTVFVARGWTGGPPRPEAASGRACQALAGPFRDSPLVGPVQAVSAGPVPAIRLEAGGEVDGEAIRATTLCAVRDQRAFVVVAAALAGDYLGAAVAFESILASFRLE